MIEPKTGKGRATRDRILAAASELMVEQGIGASSLDKILERSGTGKSQFYHYFQDRSDFLKALLDYEISGIRRLHADHLERLDSLQGIRSWFEAISGWNRSQGCRGGCPLGNYAAEVAPREENLRPTVARAFADWSAPLVRGLEAMRSRGELREGAVPAELAEFVLASVQGGFLLSRTSRDPGPLDRALGHALAYLKAVAIVVRQPSV